MIQMVRILMTFCCVFTLAGQLQAQSDSLDVVILQNRVYGGIGVGVPVGIFDQNLDGVLADVFVGYMREISYEPWIFLGLELGYRQINSREDVTESVIDDELIEELFSATSIVIPLSLVLRLYPLAERNMNPFVEGKFGPRFSGTITNYTVSDEGKDCSSLSFAYAMSAGVTINLPELFALDVKGGFEESGAARYWIDDEDLPAVFADPFENFESFRTKMSAWYIHVGVSYSF